MAVIGALFSALLAAYLVYFQQLSASNTGFSLNMAGMNGVSTKRSADISLLVGFSNLLHWWIRDLNDFEVQGELHRLDV